MSSLSRIVLVFCLLSLPASAQTWDTSGNGLLNGLYLFRQVVYQTNELGSVPETLTLVGFIRFDGQGTYNIQGTLFDTRIGQLQQYVLNGTYSIGLSGYGFLSQTLKSTSPIYGLVSSNGIFMGSTVDGFNDFMMATPAGVGGSFNFTGTYTMQYINFGGAFATAYDATAELRPNGAGGLGTVTVTSYRGLDATPTEVSLQGVTYGFNGGVGFLAFPQSPVIGGNQLMYMSPDGSFIFGGSSTHPDFFFAVRQAPPNGNPPTLGGLYYFGGIDQDNSNRTFGILNTYYGSYKAVSGTILAHQRIHHSSVEINTRAQNVGSQDTYPILPQKTKYVGKSGYRDYVVSFDGTFRIGLGRPPFLGIEVGIRAPDLTPPGVFLNPTGIVNAASYSGFTAGVAPGELMILYGTNLSNNLVVSPGVPFNLALGGVQVLMNGRPCALYYVSPGSVAAIVPYGTTEPIVQIQVVNNGQPSNVVTAYRYETSPGVFSLNSNGIGLGAARHANFSIVTEANPAHPGEIILVFLTGLGAVTPPIQDGAPGSATIFNTTTNQIYASVNGESAEIFYSGLAPTLSGMYQMNIKIPTTAVAGNLLLGIGGPESFDAQVSIPVAVP